MNDLKFAFRQLLKNPGFSAVAVLTLALGIGATTTVFSIVDGVVLKPLPYEQPGQLVQVWEAAAPGERNSVSPGAFLDWRRNSTVFEDLSIWRETDMNLTGDGQPERIKGLAMSASGLRILRARPFLGRIFSPEEDQPGRDKVVVLAHGFWQRRFGGDTNIVGQRRVIGRVKPDVPFQQADAEIKTIAARLAQAHKPNEGVTAYLVPMPEQLIGQAETALLVLLGAVAFVLLIACANLANLLLVRGAARAREIAVRGALGATRARLVRQLLTESFLLAVLGCGVGLLFAYWSGDAMRALVANRVPLAHLAGLDPTVLSFTAALTLLTGIGFGIGPAWQASRGDFNEVIKEGGRGVLGRGWRLRNALVVAETALALMLLAGAGVLIHSFLRLRAVDPGFRPDRVLTFELFLPPAQYPQDHHRAAFYQQLLERLRALPGVQAAGATLSLPLGGGGRYWTMLDIEGRAAPTSRESIPVVSTHQITPGYLEAAGMQLLKGRGIESQDSAEAPKVALISETLAKRYLPDEDPIGHRIRLGPDAGNPWLTVVGVVGDIAQDRLTEAKPPVVYSAHPQGPQGTAGAMVVAVRTTADPLRVASAVRMEVQALDKLFPLASQATLENIH